MSRFQKMSTKIWLSAVLVVLSLSGCKHSPPPPGASQLLGDGDLIVVGRVEIIPPLVETEQRLSKIGSGRYKNRGYLFLSDRFFNLFKVKGSNKHAELVELGQHFVIKRRRFENLHLSGVSIVTLRKNNGTQMLRFPGKAIYRIHEDDKAIYIGTLRYFRDAYNEIIKIEYVDEYKEGLKAFHEFQGNSKIPLRKVLPEQPSEKFSSL